MSFALWIVALFSSAWTGSARLMEFVHAIDVSLALSLAYSVLLRLGNFSGVGLDRWVDREKARVLGPLAEDKTFDGEGYERTLNTCRDRFKTFIYWINIGFMIWCVAAAFGALIALILIPFHSEMKIGGHDVLENAFLLAGPVPTGMLLLALTHVTARVRMRHHSKDGDIMIKYIAKKNTVSLAAAKEAIGQPAPIVPPKFELLSREGWIKLGWIILGLVVLTFFVMH